MEPIEGGGSAFSWEEVFAFARLCAGCGRCQTVCARKLSTADLLADIRAKNPHWTQRLWEMWIKNMGPLWPTVGFLASLAPRGLTPQMFESSLQAAMAMVAQKTGAPWATIARDPGAAFTPEPVMLFSGCTARNVRPEWTKKAAALLRSWGYSLTDASAFTCCGGTMRHAGQYRAMEDMRRTNAEAWRKMGKPRIAVFCASCWRGLTEYADGFFAQDEAAEWKSAVTPLAALLTNAVSRPAGEKPERYGYHQPCHWEQDRDMPLLAHILPGMEKGTGICCGMGGILKMTDPDLSLEMGRTCIQGISGGISHIVTGCSGCVMQLAAAAQPGMEVRHWLDVVEA